MGGAFAEAAEFGGQRVTTDDANATTAERTAFRRDGAVLLRGWFSPEWIDTLRDDIDADLARSTENFARHTLDPNAMACLEDCRTWSKIPQFEDLARRSPCAPLAARLLDAPSVILVMDNWFLREAGSKSRPPFQQDLSCFDFEGIICVLWLPLDPAAKENGVAFVRG